MRSDTDLWHRKGSCNWDCTATTVDIKLQSKNQSIWEDSKFTDKRVDPAAVLPVEIFSLILQHSPTIRSVIALQRVSKRWERMLKSICTPSWIVRTHGIDADWCLPRRKEGIEGSDIVDDDRRWVDLRHEARRCNNMRLGQPDSILSTYKETQKHIIRVYSPTTYTYARPEYVVTLVDLERNDAGMAETWRNRIRIFPRRSRDTEGSSNHCFASPITVERKGLFEACGEVDPATYHFDMGSRDPYPWIFSLFGTGPNCVLAYLGHQEDTLQQMIVCISTTTGSVLWARSPTSEKFFPQTMQEIGQSKLSIKLNYQLGELCAENVTHSNSSLFTYLLRPIGGREPQLLPSSNRYEFLCTGNHPITIKSFDLTTGKTVEDLTWEIENVGYCTRNGFGDMAAVAELPTGRNGLGAFRVFVYWNTVEQKWVLNVLDLGKKNVVAQCYLQTDLENEGRYDPKGADEQIDWANYNPDNVYPSYFDPVLSIFISILPDFSRSTDSSIAKTIFITRYFYKGDETHRAVAATANLTMKIDPQTGACISAELKNTETSYYDMPLKSPAGNAGNWSKAPLLNPRARIAASVRSIPEGSKQPRPAGPVNTAAMVISFTEETERCYRDPSSRTIVSFWKIKDGTPLTVLPTEQEESSETWLERVKSSVGSILPALWTEEKMEQTIEEKKVERVLHKIGNYSQSVLDVRDDCIVMSDAVAWFD